MGDVVNLYSDFEIWFAECAQICMNHFVSDEAESYVWNLHDCQEWRDMFRKELPPFWAVAEKFKQA